MDNVLIYIVYIYSLPTSAICSYPLQTDSTQIRPDKMLGSDLDPICLTLRWYSFFFFFEKVDFEKNKTNSTNLYPRRRGYLRETCKSQNINAIYLTLSSFSVLFRPKQTPVKYVLVLSLIKNILTSAQFQYLTFKLIPRGQE